MNRRPARRRRDRGLAFWTPTPALDDAARHRGIRAYQLDGICSQIRDSLLSGPLLVGYALLLGASNTVVGLLAAISPATQILQIPTVALIERWRVRKAICWWAALVGRAAWFGALAVPWLSPRTRVPGLVTWLLVSAAFATVAGAAWNAWMRDFLPDATRNQVVARRMAIATAVGAMLTLAAGAAIDGLRPALHSAVAPYTLILGVGAVVGLLGLAPLGAIPEPAMTLAARRPWRDILGAPLRDREFRGLIAFLAAWTFAINLSAPFFTVYLLRRLGLPMAAVLALTVLSQLTTAAMFRAWGVVADRFHARTVLRVSCVGFLLSVAGWPVVGALDTPWLVLAGVAAIHVVAGVSAAGVNLCTSTVAMELAPRGQAASYLASNALVSGVAAALAPVIAGLAADGLETQRFSAALVWTSTLGTGHRLALEPLDLHGLDFLFIATLVVGLYAVHRILAVGERARGDRRAVMAALAEEMRGLMPPPLRGLSTVPGVRDVVALPISLVSWLLPERRRSRRHARSRADRQSGPGVPEVAAGSPQNP